MESVWTFGKTDVPSGMGGAGHLSVERDFIMTWWLLVVELLV